MMWHLYIPPQLHLDMNKLSLFSLCSMNNLTDLLNHAVLNSESSMTVFKIHKKCHRTCSYYILDKYLVFFILFFILVIHSYIVEKR